MSLRPALLRVYIGIIGVAAAGVIAWSVSRAIQEPHDFIHQLPIFVGFVALSAVSSWWRVHATQTTEWVMGTAAQIAILLLFPPAIAVLIVATAKIGTSVQERIRQRNIRAKYFIINTGGVILATFAGGATFYLLHGSTIVWATGGSHLIALPLLAATGLVYHEIDVSVVIMAVTLSSREMPWTVFARVTRGTFPPEAANILVGMIFAALWHYTPVLSLLTLAPLVLGLRAFEAVARLQRETMESVLKMADSIDFRDTQTYEHSKRLADMSGRLALLAGLTIDHVEEIKLAARVHDLGKIGIGNEILLKQGPLTAEERRAMEEHPVIGETILSSYSAFKGSLKIVRHHHEQWDGSGYPDGLKGDEIPIGARIISVVDSFDAMTADRPYRRGMPVPTAVERLKAGMGTQFDSRLCGLFIQMLIEDGIYDPGAQEVDARHSLRGEAS